MTIDNHSVVYFINDEYGVVIRVNGATGEAAMWDKTKGLFTRRIDLLTASFLARTDRYEGKWCAAHPTRSRIVAENAAKRTRRSASLPAADGMKLATAAKRTRRSASLPAADGMKLATAAKRAATFAELHDCGAERVIAEAKDRWQAREAFYAGL